MDPAGSPSWQKTTPPSFFSEVFGFFSLKDAGWRLFFVFRQKGMTSLTDMHMQVPPHTPLLTVASLFHSISQHLIGRNKHNADDEGHGKGADQAFAHTRLSVLLCWMDWSEERNKETCFTLASEQLRWLRTNIRLNDSRVGEMIIYFKLWLCRCLRLKMF